MMHEMTNAPLIDPEPIRQSARRFQLGFQMGFIATLAAAAALGVTLFVNPTWTGGALADAVGYPLASPRFWQSTALVLIGLVMLGTYAAVFRVATTVCRMLVQTDLTEAAGAARRLSNWLWVLLGMSILSNTLGILVATAHAGPGQRALSIALGSPQVTFAIAALIAAFLARAFVLGAALWQDHREIV